MDTRTFLELPRFDSRAPEVLDDPYPTYAALRAAGPVCRGGAGQWVATRYADVAALLRDKRLSNQYPPEYHRLSVGDGPAAEFFARILLDLDPPAHPRLRRALGTGFSPALLKRLNDLVVARVDAMLDEALAGDRIDVVTRITLPLPVDVVCELIGIPAADRDVVRPWAMALARGFSLKVKDEDRSGVHDAVSRLRDYIGSLIPAAASLGGEGLLAHLLTVLDAHDPETLADIVDNLVFLFFAGFETTTNLLSTSLYGLATNPDAWHELRRNPGLIDSATEEFLRYDAPIQATARLVREPMIVGDVKIRPNRVLVLLLGSANHDEAVFDEPERLNLSRRPNPHVSFGGGAHHCIGAVLARMETRLLLAGLLNRVDHLGVAGVTERRESATFRSWARMELALSPR